MSVVRNKGGAPKKAWTRRRERKLVRLYTMTNLGMDEIQTVLEEDGFKPGSVEVSLEIIQNY